MATKAIVKVGKTAYRFIEGIETVNRTDADGKTEVITIEEAIKDKEFIARLINKKSPIIEEVKDLVDTAAKGSNDAEVTELKKQLELSSQTLLDANETIKAQAEEIEALKEALNKLQGSPVKSE